MAYQPKSYRKFLAGSVSAALVATAVGPVVASAASFSDVNPSDPHAENISALVELGYIKGFTDGTFKPYQSITRGQVAKIFARILKDQGFQVPEDKKAFDDVPVDAQDQELVEAAAIVKAAGVMTGTDGKLNPGQPITRQQMAKVLVEAFDLTRPADFKSQLGDLDKADPSFRDYIQTLEANGITKTADNNYRPTDTVTRAAFSSFVKRALDAQEAAKAPKVESVSAINAKELVIKFNKAIKKSSVIETSGPNIDTLVDGVFKFDGGAGDALKASLSSDGKELTVTTGTTWEGTHSVELIADKVETVDGKKLGQYVTAFTYKDDVRASITGVEFVNKYTYKVKFSEPVQSVGSVTAKYSDGTSVILDTSAPNYGLSSDGKSFTVVFDPATEANKEISISFPAVTDYANNISVPLTAKVIISDADKTKPVVSSVTPTSYTTLKVKFSEPINLLDPTKVSFNGSSLTASDVAVDANDNTVLNVTVPRTTTSGVLAIATGAVEDLNNNQNDAFSQTVNFAVDKVAPQVTKFEVVKESGVNKLRVTFSEEVSKNPTAGNLTLKYTDAYGVQKTVTIPAAKVTVDTNDPKVAVIELHDGTNAIKEDVNYTFDLPAGYFQDKFENDSVAKTISFLNKADATVTKLSLIPTNPIVTTDATGGSATRANSGAFIDVQFADAVDPTTATNVNNYVVEGAEVSKAELVYNDPTTAIASGAKAVVRVYIKDNTVEETGYYNVTVKGVKGYNSSVTVMDPETRNIQIVENTRPTVKSAAVKAFNGTNNTTTVTITFSEPIATDTVANGDFDLYVDGVKVSTATVTNGALGASSIDFTIAEDLSDELAAGKVVKLVPTSEFDLLDANNNKADVKEVIIK